MLLVLTLGSDTVLLVVTLGSDTVLLVVTLGSDTVLPQTTFTLCDVLCRCLPVEVPDDVYTV